ncbi:ATP/GTP phosphatase [Streptococcus parauberis]|uniref:ATP-dependent nuclease n=1 Tax=Streptococcus parauberis TaxID=1348 RepID=UPI000976E6FA|nr:AAA family ATPase [Streptococcus parauberis]ONH63216.1 ATP/GTP phosphatase [Streptococcus parauberis]PCH11549.1 ATP/GTP phosphatase [Streptococcus parauberis]
MIDKIVIKNFKQFSDLEIDCNAGRNIFIGENGSGKSSILQAINLVMSGSYAQIEKNGLINLFNSNSISDFLSLGTHNFPELLVELYFNDSIPEIKDNYKLEGKHNSMKLPQKFGISLKISPNDELMSDITDSLRDSNRKIFPFEFYKVEFRTFSDEPYNSYNKPFKFNFSIVDTSLINTKLETRKRIDEIYNDSVLPENRAKINNEFRKKTDEFITKIIDDDLMEEKDYRIAIDNSSEYSFKEKLTALKSNIDIKNFGQGEKVILSVENSYKRRNDKTKLILVEEPENHLSFSNMHLLLDIVESEKHIQTFISTHSNMIASRLEIDSCIFLNNGIALSLKDLDKETVKFFQKSTNQHILNFILGNKCILVEGNAEYILMNKFYSIMAGNTPNDDSVYILSVDGLSFERYLKVAQRLTDKKVAVITDNDKDYQKTIINKYSDYDANENIKIFSDTDNQNYTFEVCLYNSNKTMIDGSSLTVRSDKLKYMLNNKAESALRMLDIVDNDFIIPSYITEAIEWIRND